MADSERNWEILDSRVIFSDRWLTVRTDRCRTPAGLVLETYHIIEYSDWLHVVAITSDLEVLTLREYRHGAARVVRGLPAGMIEKHDPSPTQAAHRELAEETGYGNGQIVALGAAFANPAVQNNRVHSFLAFGLEKIGEQRLDPSESIEIHHEPFEAFARKALKRELEFQALHLAGVHDALMHILSAGALPDAHPTLRKLRELTLKSISFDKLPAV